MKASMATVCVYCGSSPGGDPAFINAARVLGRHLAAEGHRLIYGGGNVGLMGAIADSVLENGGEVVGVIPEHLIAKEVAHSGLSQLLVVATMHERKLKMAQMADCFLALPGGVGTLEEIAEAFVWTQLGIHRKACGILNVNGFYDPLVALLEHMSRSRFLKPSHREQVLVGQEPIELLERLLAMEVTLIDKWMDRS